MKAQNLPTIGQNELVSIGTRAIDVPAKIDTGADSSSIWATDIRVSRDRVLSFKLFGQGSQHYTGEALEHTDFKAVAVRSSTGEEQIRYRTRLPLSIAGRKIHVLFTLSDRSRNNYKILIGRRTIQGRFIVDVTKETIRLPKNPSGRALNKQLSNDPYEFHKKYVKNINNKQKETI